ncbi:hypothetical protein VNO77_42785 [Canavalia gladiata]|uniref:Uncharacterized protein n=1 Tax=Canavalia gladiata TaxID=3824 RepID=A0AAN9PPC9_CANGL
MCKQFIYYDFLWHLNFLLGMIFDPVDMAIKWVLHVALRVPKNLSIWRKNLGLKIAKVGLVMSLVVSSLSQWDDGISVLVFRPSFLKNAGFFFNSVILCIALALPTRSIDEVALGSKGSLLSTLNSFGKTNTLGSDRIFGHLGALFNVPLSLHLALV